MTDPTGDRLEVARVVKPHGLRGQVVVELWTNRAERMSAGSVLEAAGTPLEIEQASPLPGVGGRDRWLVRFAGVDTLEQAERWRDTVLWAAPLDVEGAVWVHELVGAVLVDTSGSEIGVVEAVEANPASDLLVLADGRVVPLTFVWKKDGRWVVDGPAGLLDQ